MRRGRPRKDGGGDCTDQHIIMQLRKVINLHGKFVVEFRNGDKKAIHPTVAEQVCEKYNSLPHLEKFKFQDHISYSLENFESSLKA